jgi:Ni/Co efflux regulator RcnB
MKTKRLIAAAAVAGATAATLMAAPTAASASGGGADVRASGTCSGSTHWRLKAKHDDGRIETEYEIDSNRNGQTWRVRLWDNGDRYFAGPRVTQAPSGSFTVHRSTANRSGADHITARATNISNGEVCRGHVTL